MTIEELIKIIESGINQVPQEYFLLKTTYKPNGIVRERIFCYELYYQIKKLYSEESILKLHGEIDKGGHPDFKEIGRKNPDFVFHVPGTHSGNAIVCEVKGRLNSSHIMKDFNKILSFLDRYQAGLFILYNHSLKELRNRLKDKLSAYKNEEFGGRVYIICIESEKNLDEIILLREI